MRSSSQPSNPNIIGYNVRQMPNGGFVETPIYAEPTSVVRRDAVQDFDESYDAVAAYSDIDEAEVEYDQPVRQSKERKVNSKPSIRGNPLAKAAFILLGATTVVYGTDAGITYLKDDKLISPVDAYKDFIELPSLVKPAIDTVQGVAKLIGGN